MAQKSDYVVRESRFVLGIWRQKGAVVALTEKQAKYLAPPYGNDVVLRQADDEVAGQAQEEAGQGGASPSSAPSGHLLPVNGEKGKR